MSLPPREEIANLKSCSHGGINYAELRALGLTPATVLDFSVCTNPFMPPPGTEKAVTNIDTRQYPDSAATELRERLARTLGVTPDNILVGSGTTELIRLIALAYFRKQDPVLIIEPTYGEYELACRIAGAQPVKLRTGEANNFALKVTDAVNLIKDCRPRAIFICNPNNPTGQYLSCREVEQLVAAGSDGLLVIDEAYVNFAADTWPSVDLISGSNVVILRSMTKDYGLAGLRLGYAIAGSEVINILHKVCPPWNVNTVAQKTGFAVLEETDYLKQSQKKVTEAKQFLVGELSRLGYATLPSATNYFLIKAGNATEFRASLLKHGILVRDCTSFGLPGYVRIAPRTMPECRRLINIIEGFHPPGDPPKNSRSGIWKT